MYNPLEKQEIINVIEGKSNASRIPVLLHFWIHPEEFGERKEKVLEILNQYPEDAQIIEINMPKVYDAPHDNREYRWVNYADPYINKKVAIDVKIAISDWAQLEDILDYFPDPEYTNMFVENPSSDGRYRLGHWWFCLFERHWELRGMTNALMDYYLYPEEVHKLFRKLTDFYMRVMERAKIELDIDGIFTSDDLGTQTGPFFSPEIFDEFFMPYYKELIGKAHELNMHFWLHACGNINQFLPKFVELGLDVIHPIQKYTMDEKEIAKLYGEDICIWAGFDVQQIIPWGSAEDVRVEVRYLIETYKRSNGRLMLTAGNGINGDCPLDSLSALFVEVFASNNTN